MTFSSAAIECITAINVSVKDQLSLSISVAVGSTIVSEPHEVALAMVFTKLYAHIANSPVRHSGHGHPGMGSGQTSGAPVRPIRIRGAIHLGFVVVTHIYAVLLTSSFLF